MASFFSLKILLIRLDNKGIIITRMKPLQLTM